MLTSTQSYVTYQGNGAITIFPYSFAVAKAAYLQVEITNNNVSPPVSVVLLSSQYSATGIGNGILGAPNPTPGGTVTYPLSGSPLANGWSITIRRVVPYQQNTSLENQGGFYPEVVEAALDYLTMQTQQLALSVSEVSNLSLSISQPVTFPANLATQSLAGLASVYKTANTQATVLTGFSDMTPGHRFKIIIADTCTVVRFAAWWSGLPTGGIIGHQGQTVAFTKGDVLDCVTDGNYVYAIDSEPMVPAILPLPAGLLITNVSGSNTDISVNAGSVTLPNVAGLKLFQTWASQVDMAPLSFTASGASLGAGGLDSGSLTASTWYYLWLIGDGANIKALLSTGPFWTFVDKTYVSAYTYARLVGCALTDANAHFIRFHQFGNKVLFDIPQFVSLPAQANYTQCSTAPFPPGAVTGLFSAYFLASTGAGTFAFSADGTNDYFLLYAVQNASAGEGQFELPLFTPNSFWYKNSNVSGTPGVSVRGFLLNL